MDHTIYFKEHPTTSTRRNGAFTTIGINVSRYAQKVELSGITSKNNLARGDIEIPLCAIPELIQTLQEIQTNI